jgi:hypothetical protein
MCRVLVLYLLLIVSVLLRVLLCGVVYAKCSVQLIPLHTTARLHSTTIQNHNSEHQVTNAAILNLDFNLYDKIISFTVLHIYKLICFITYY